MTRKYHNHTLQTNPRYREEETQNDNMISQRTWHGRIQRRDRGSGSPLKNQQTIGFLSNTARDPLKNQRATKQAFNVGPSSARQRMTFRWRTDDGPFIVVFGSSIPSSTKKKVERYQIWTPSDKTFWTRACLDFLFRFIYSNFNISFCQQTV